MHHPNPSEASSFDDASNTEPEVSPEVFEIAVDNLLNDLAVVFIPCTLEYYLVKQKVLRLIHWFTVEVGTWERAEELKNIITERPFYKWHKEYKQWLDTL